MGENSKFVSASIKQLPGNRRLLRQVEKAVLRKRFESDSPQLFILGLPRSGTTLVYQYIVHRLKVAYFTNGVGEYRFSPCLVTYLQRKLYEEYESDFDSHYGKVIGPVAPREAGGFWGRFFDLEAYASFDDLSDEEAETLRNTIACVQSVFGGAPFVNKNVKHMLRIDALSRLFPNSYFLCVERDLESIALSVLRGRYKNLTDPTMWWSVRPPNYAELLDLSPAEQVARQLVLLEEKMESDLRQVSSNRIIRMGYTQFCKDPESLTETLQSVIGPNEYRNPPEPSFPTSENKVSTSEEQRMIELLRLVKD